MVKAISTLIDGIHGWNDPDQLVSLRTELGTVFRIFKFEPQNDLVCIRLKFEQLHSLSLEEGYSKVMKISEDYDERFSYEGLSSLFHKVQYENDDISDWEAYCQSLNSL